MPTASQCSSPKLPPKDDAKRTPKMPMRRENPQMSALSSRRPVVSSSSSYADCRTPRAAGTVEGGHAAGVCADQHVAQGRQSAPGPRARGGICQHGHPRKRLKRL
jgi:hypothetical protein